MGIGRVNTGGGRAEGLRLAVVGGTTAPANPTENTIWANTATEISDWYAANAAPASPVEGMVWIATGKSSILPIAVTDSLVIYPLNCYQYVGGVWSPKDTKVWMNGAWRIWNLSLYSPGNENASVTGGWTARGMVYDSSTTVGAAPAITRASTYLLGSLTSPVTGYRYSGAIGPAWAIDVTDYATAKLSVYGVSGSYEGYIYLLARTVGGGWTSGAYARIYPPGASSTVFNLNIASLTGSRYIEIFFAGVNFGSSQSCQVQSLELIP